MELKHLMMIEKMSLKQLTINAPLHNEKIKFLEAYMQQTSLQIYNVIAAFEEEKES